MRATELLESQHRYVESLFRKLVLGTADPHALVREVADSLGAHMFVEQELFYPAVRLLEETLVSESFEEHALVELALQRVLSTPPSDTTFRAKVMTLKGVIEYHVVEEEEGLFPIVERQLGPAALDDLAERMKIAYREAFQRGFDALVPASTPRTSADRRRRPVALGSH